MTCGGFEIGCIVEALNDVGNVIEYAGEFKWIGGHKPTDYNYKTKIFSQNVEDLKRFKGKIK